MSEFAADFGYDLDEEGQPMGEDDPDRMDSGDESDDKKAKDGRLSLKSATSGQPVHIDWLDPTNVEAQDYIADLVKEVIDLGADEVQLDYVRFAVYSPGIKNAAMPPPDGHRTQAPHRPPDRHRREPL